MLVKGPQNHSNAIRATKDMVPVTVHLKNGTVIPGELFVMKTGQRLQDLLNDTTRKFLPLRTNTGAVQFINRDSMEIIAAREV
jgi:hypothetical protein